MKGVIKTQSDGTFTVSFSDDDGNLLESAFSVSGVDAACSNLKAMMEDYIKPQSVVADPMGETLVQRIQHLVDRHGIHSRGCTTRFGWKNPCDCWIREVMQAVSKRSVTEPDIDSENLLYAARGVVRIMAPILVNDIMRLRSLTDNEFKSVKTAVGHLTKNVSKIDEKQKTPRAVTSQVMGSLQDTAQEQPTVGYHVFRVGGTVNEKRDWVVSPARYDGEFKGKDRFVAKELIYRAPPVTVAEQGTTHKQLIGESAWYRRLTELMAVWEKSFSEMNTPLGQYDPHKVLKYIRATLEENIGPSTACEDCGGTGNVKGVSCSKCRSV